MRANELFETNYLDLKILKKFQKTKFGMINLKGELYPTEMYDHLALFKKKPVVPEVYDMFQDLDERLADAQDEHIASVPEGEHPEWHVYEIYAADETHDVETKAMKIIYEQGWGRLGTTSNILELECFAEHLSTLQKYAKEIAEMLDVEFISNVINKGTNQSKVRLDYGAAFI